MVCWMGEGELFNTELDTAEAMAAFGTLVRNRLG